MKAWVRRQVDQLCQHANASFTDIALGGTPTDEFFGATGFEGVSESAARSDHLHGMPSIEDILADDAFFFDDCILTTPGNVFSISAATTTVTARDDIGSLGAFGSFDVRCSNNASGNCGVMVQNQAAVSATAQIHLWQRVRELSIRCAPGITTTNSAGFNDLNQVLVAVGGMRSNAQVFGGAGTVVADILHGVYFLLTTDATGVGNWFAVAESNNVQTTVDTGVPVISSGSSFGYQNFKITYDHPTTTATYFIDDVQVAAISTNIPTATQKIAGFGMWKQQLAAGGLRQTDASFDRLLYVGDRVAQT